MESCTVQKVKNTSLNMPNKPKVLLCLHIAQEKASRKQILNGNNRVMLV